MLSRSIVPLQLISTLEQSVADNVSQQPLVVENLICDKLGQLQKRWGYDLVGNTIMGQEEQLTDVRYISERRGELVAFTDFGAYKYAASANQMIQVSRAILTEVDKTSIIRNNYNQSYAQMAKMNNVVVTVYRDSRGGCRYSALDESSQTLLKNDVSLGNITNPTFLTFGSKLLLFYVKDADSKICFKQFDLGSFGLLDEVVVEDAVVGTYKLFRVKPFSVSKFSLGYTTSGGKLSLGFYGIDGSEATARDAVPDRFEVTSSFTLGFDYVIENTDQIYHRVVWPTLTKINLQAFKEDGSAVAAVVELTSYTDMHAFTVSFDTDVFVAWDKTDTTPQEYVTYGGKWTLAGVQVTAPYIIGAGLSLVSEAFMIGDTRYVLTNYTSVFQPNNFVMSEYGSVAAKFNKDEALQHRTIVGNLVGPVLDAGSWRFALDSRTKLVQQGDFWANNYGISVFTMDYSEISPTSATLDKTLHITGSILRDYDGATFAEAGFLLSPDSSVMAAVSTGVKASGFISATGKLTFTAVNVGTSGNSISVAFTTGATAGSEVVSVVGNAISVQVQSGVSTAAQIKTKIEASAPAMALISTVITTAGVMTAPATVTLANGVGGNLSAGAYQYKAVYSWMDNFGTIHVSGESGAISVTALLNDGFSVTVPTLFVTDKSDVLIELYRTTASGLVFLLAATAVNDKTQVYTTVVDTISDTLLAAEPIIYTDGGVLSNNSFATCKAITVNDNRLIIGGDAGLPDAVFYTKEKASPYSAGPSDFLTLNTGARGGSIVALKSFGDVTIVLKDTCIGVISGQYATDTGLLVSLKYDVISEEVGCISHQSLIEIDKGVIFQSSRGLCLVGKDLNIAFIGAPVEKMRDYPITSAAMLSNIQTVVFTTADNSAICMNYGKNAWSTFTGHEAISAVTVGSEYYMLMTDGRILKRNTASKTDAGFSIISRLKSQWYQLGGIGGFERLYSLSVQGMVEGAHGLKVSMYYDFETNPRENLLYATGSLSTFGDTGTFGTVIIDQTKPLQQIRVQPRWQKCTSVSVELSEWVPDDYSPNANIVWNGIRLEIGIKRGAYKFDASQAAKSLSGG